MGRESQQGDSDNLEGAEEIAVFMQWWSPDGTPNTRRAYYEAELKRWPIFKRRTGRGSSRLLASKSSMLRCREARIKQAEQEALGAFRPISEVVTEVVEALPQRMRDAV